MLENRTVSTFRSEQVNWTTEGFQREFDSFPEILVRCPARVNLIGEHTDYNDGFVLPMAIPFETLIAASPSGNNMMTVTSEGFGSMKFSLEDNPMQTPGWGRFIHGMGSFMSRSKSAPLGWSGYISSTIPSGANLSSSAALEVASGTVFKSLGAMDVSLTEIALLGKRVENELIGVSSGVMDQLACALSQQGNALLLDCLSLDTSPVLIPEGTGVVIMDTGTRRELKSTSYNDRRKDCEVAASALGFSSLRDASMSDLKSLTDAISKRRAHHVVSENERVLKVVRSFAENDSATAGDLFNQSHTSLKEDFAVSSPALDRIVEIATTGPGCFGARMTGGGFAGSAVALVDKDQVHNFCNFVRDHFECPESQPAVASTRIYPVEASAGVSIL